MPNSDSHRPVGSRVVRPDDGPADRDERRVRAMVDALTVSDPADDDIEQGARRAVLGTLIDDGSVTPEKLGSPRRAER